MPLPKPLKKGASKKAKQKRTGEVMHDLKHGPHHKERTHKQEVAIALQNAGASRKKAKKRKKR